MLEIDIFLIIAGEVDSANFVPNELLKVHFMLQLGCHLF
jgi:hypothetical protein